MVFRQSESVGEEMVKKKGLDVLSAIVYVSSSGGSGVITSTNGSPFVAHI